MGKTWELREKRSVQQGVKSGSSLMGKNWGLVRSGEGGYRKGAEVGD